MLITAECIQINKYRIALHTARVLHTQMVRVSEHAHDLLLYFILAIG